LLGLAVVFGEVLDLPAIVAQVSDRCRLMWWLVYHLLLLRCSRGTVVLLLLRLVLLAVALEQLQRSTWLSHGWCIDNVVLRRRTT
jgi:hypothetical protein